MILSHTVQIRKRALQPTCMNISTICPVFMDHHCMMLKMSMSLSARNLVTTVQYIRVFLQLQKYCVAYSLHFLFYSPGCVYC
jgi:hypothetical protein